MDVISAFEPFLPTFFEFPLWEDGDLPSQFVQVWIFGEVQNMERNFPLIKTFNFEEKPRSVTMWIYIIF